MAIVHKVIFYPVGNGDTSQVVLANERRVLFDFCHRGKAEDTSTPEIDLKKRLKEELKDAKRDYFDVVAFIRRPFQRLFVVSRLLSSTSWLSTATTWPQRYTDDLDWLRWTGLREFWSSRPTNKNY